MPRLRPLIHPRLHGRLRRSFFSRTVTIQAFAAGARTSTGYQPRIPADLPEHVDLAASIEPLDTRGQSERRTEQLTADTSTHQILLLGHFPTITPRMRVVDDAGEVYDISRADIDSLQTLTRLLVRQVTPTAVEGA